MVSLRGGPAVGSNPREARPKERSWTEPKAKEASWVDATTGLPQQRHFIRMIVCYIGAKEPP